MRLKQIYFLLQENRLKYAHVDETNVYLTMRGNAALTTVNTACLQERSAFFHCKGQNCRSTDVIVNVTAFARSHRSRKFETLLDTKRGKIPHLQAPTNQSSTVQNIRIWVYTIKGLINCQ